MKSMKKTIALSVCLAISSSSLSSNILAQEDNDVILYPCESTLIGTPEIVEQTTEVVDYLLEVNMKMPYEYVFIKIDEHTLSAEVVEGYKLSEDEILEIGEQLSLKAEISGGFFMEGMNPQKIIFDEEGYEYVRPAVFAKYTKVKVPVNKQVEKGMCQSETQWSYIAYPMEFLIDGKFSN